MELEKIKNTQRQIRKLMNQSNHQTGGSADPSLNMPHSLPSLSLFTYRGAKKKNMEHHNSTEERKQSPTTTSQHGAEIATPKTNDQPSDSDSIKSQEQIRQDPLNIKTSELPASTPAPSVTETKGESNPEEINFNDDTPTDEIDLHIKAATPLLEESKPSWDLERGINCFDTKPIAIKKIQEINTKDKNSNGKRWKHDQFHPNYMV